MRIVKITSILSTIVLFILIALANESFASSILKVKKVNLSSVENITYEAMVSDNENEHFTRKDLQDLNDFELFMTANEMFDYKKHVVLTGARITIKVYTKSQILKVYVGGERKYSWKTTTGSYARYGRGASTPKGPFKPYAMTLRHHSTKGYTLPYAIKMDRGYFIHGTKANHMLGKKLSKRVGSHGCMRLSMSHARTLYKLVKRSGLANTKIIVY